MTTEQIDYVLSNYTFHILIGLGVLIIALFIIVLVQGLLIGRMRTLYSTIFDKKDDGNIDEMLINNKKVLDSIIIKQEATAKDFDDLRDKVASKMSKSATYKYNAFDNMAGNLSFVYILLNDEDSGFILNGIYSNDGHYLYLKEIVNGKSPNLLSNEESETLKKAIKGN